MQSPTPCFAAESHRIVLRVYDGASDVIETHEHAAKFCEF
jgi:hypothetical protein